mmetsp:Transcript_21767/g.51379  ORF Transcript_21767/g.51379 Transcript_21767/m.51379 type:complete len:484 (-) Transcript_21767:96-1547(-)
MMSVRSSLLLMMIVSSSTTTSFFCHGFSSSRWKKGHSSLPSSHAYSKRQRSSYQRTETERRQRRPIPPILSSSSLWSSYDDNGNNRNGGSPSDSSGHQKFPLDWRDDSRINVLNLLTQRSVQSFLYLCESVRDPHSGKWIQDFFDCPNQLEYHGTGANYVSIPSPSSSSSSTTTVNANKPRYVGDGTWDGPLLAMVEQPKDVVIVSAKRRGAGHGGWSKDNPYLQDRYVEFEIDIDPVSLTSRILSVREQIAKEWLIDLEVLKEANDQILTSYFQLAKIERTKRNSELLETPTVAFDRTAVNLMNNQTIFANGSSSSSPFRKGNFDLLYNLCTQASIHRLLREMKDSGEAQMEVPFEWLREFYVDRVEEYFDGDQQYGRADDFIEELLLSSPSIVHRDDGKIALADPFYLSEKVIETRNIIVAEWKEAMKHIPSDHQDGIRRILLDKQMSAWGSGGVGGFAGSDSVSGASEEQSSSAGGPSFQ